VTGDAWTTYGSSGGGGVAIVSGRVSAAPAHAHLGLMALSFPYKASPVVVGSSILAADSKYRYTVRPELATKYWLDVFSPGTKSSPMAESKVVPVYVTAAGTSSPAKAEACERPVCHQNYEVFMRFPPTVAKAEAFKHRYTYFGLAMSPTAAPAPPKSLRLVSDFHLGKVTRRSSTEYEWSLSFSFRINNDGYHFSWALCTKDTEAEDGLGLPGSHGCGSKTAPATVPYLG
jgi:hypothetical protein